jgi:hypothetical protein
VKARVRAAVRAELETHLKHEPGKTKFEVKEVPFFEIKDDLSRYPREAETQEGDDPVWHTSPWQVNMQRIAARLHDKLTRLRSNLAYTPTQNGNPAGPSYRCVWQAGLTGQSQMTAVASISTRAEAGVRALTWTSVLAGRI